MFVLCQVARWNVIPSWFQFVGEIKELYQKKYYKREESNLPHYFLVEKINKRKKAKAKKFPFGI